MKVVRRNKGYLHRISLERIPLKISDVLKLIFFFFFVFIIWLFNVSARLGGSLLCNKETIERRMIYIGFSVILPSKLNVQITQ